MAKKYDDVISHGIYDYRGADLEVNDGKSNVLPDQAFTISELFERSKAGMPLAFQEVHFSEDAQLGDLDVSKLAGMDIVNQKIALRSFTERVQRYQAQLDKLYLEEQEAAKAKQLADLFEAQKASGSAANPVPGK